jgi:hypothetical protein
LASLVIFSSLSLCGANIEDSFPEEAVNMTAEQEQAIQKAIDFIEQQIVSIIIRYMDAHRLQYAVFAGMVYEINGENIYSYSLDDLEEQQALWLMQFDITDYVLDQLSNEIPDVIA